MLNQEELLQLRSLMIDVINEVVPPLLDQRFTTIEKRLDSLEQRLDSLEQRLDTIEKRLDSLELRLDIIEKRLDKLEKRLNKLTKEIKEIKLELNEVIDWFDKRHHIHLQRFERVEKRLGMFNPQDPMILYDAPSKDIKYQSK